MAPKIPFGSQVKSVVEQAYSLGHRFSDAWDIVTGRSFNPGVPLQPISDKEEITQGPRQYQYPVAANLTPKPRTEQQGLTPFEQLRNLSALYDVAAICIATRVEEFQGLAWSIVTKDKKQQKQFQPECDAVADWWRYPDRLNEFPSWLSMLLYDLFSIDAMTLYRKMDNGGRLYSLEVVDGATIKPLLDDRGIVRAYQQILYGYPRSQYNRYGSSNPEFEPHELMPIYSPGELIYRPRWTRSFTPYGNPPSELVILRVNTAIRKQSFDLRYFTDGNIPDMIFTPGKDVTLTPEQVSKFEEWFNGVLEGNDAARRKARFLAWDAQPKELKQFSYDTKLDDWMMRVTCAAYGVPPNEIGFTDSVNKASAGVQENVNSRRGIKPLANWLKLLFDRVIQVDMGFPMLEWQWHLEEQQDSLDLANSDQIYIQNGVLTANEVRTMRFADVIDGPAPPEPPQAPGGAPPPALPAPSDDSGDEDNSSESSPNSYDSSDSSDSDGGNVFDVSGGDDSVESAAQPEDLMKYSLTKLLEMGDLEKRRSSGPRKTGPGSRGGKYWIDKSGKIRYGTPPTGVRGHKSQSEVVKHAGRLARSELKGVKTFADANKLDGWEWGVSGDKEAIGGKDANGMAQGYNHFGTGKAGHDAALAEATKDAKSHPDLTYAVMRIDGNYVVAAKSTEDLLKTSPEREGATPSAPSANAKPDNLAAAQTVADLLKRYYSQSERDSMDNSDFAGPNQSFPIKTQKDVYNAAKLIGHADNPDAVKAKIKSIARRKGFKLPKSWEKEEGK